MGRLRDKPLVIRDALESDAAGIAALLVDSIRELCAADHGGASDALDQWLSNKTSENIRQWLAHPQNLLLVAEFSGEIAAVGGLRTSGTVTLNYVAPAFRFQGVSKAMVAELERRASHLGLKTLTLASTVTAHEFYRSLEYRDVAQPETKHGLLNYPMTKAIR